MNDGTRRARVHQFALLCYIILRPRSTVACPMTDGAARVLEIEGEQDLCREIVPHLISRDPDTMWTAGQWMTERSERLRMSAEPRPSRDARVACFDCMEKSGLPPRPPQVVTDFSPDRRFT